MASTVTSTFASTKLFLISAITFLLILLHVAVIFGLNPNRTQSTAAGGTETPASLTALVAGCGGYFHWETNEGQARVIPDEQMDRANVIPETPMVVPVYGYMAEQGIDRYGWYEAGTDELPTREQVVRTLYDGGSVIWYVPTMDPGDRNLLREWAHENEDRNIAVIPWTGDRSFPYDRTIAFSTWGTSQSCAFWDETAFEEFTQFSIEKGNHRPDTKTVVVPETGILPSLPGSTQ